MGFINVDTRGDERGEEEKKQWDGCVIRSGEREIREQDPKVMESLARVSTRGIGLLDLF